MDSSPDGLDCDVRARVRNTRRPVLEDSLS